MDTVVDKVMDKVVDKAVEKVVDKVDMIVCCTGTPKLINVFAF